MPLLTGHDAGVADWVASNLGVTIAPPYTALGVLDAHDCLIGGAVFSGYSGANIDVTIYGPRAVTRGALRASFVYVFGQLRCQRATARCKRTNVAMRRLVERIGFRYEGTQRRYWGPTRNDDAMLYGMVRDECRWIDAGSKTARPDEDRPGTGGPQQANGANAIPARRHRPDHTLW